MIVRDPAFANVWEIVSDESMFDSDRVSTVSPSTDHTILFSGAAPV
ncbi:hypothetical protein [Haladaptatus litoreus]|nr:hypothetical protein [Haladaptatus litoreus]